MISPLHGLSYVYEAPVLLLLRAPLALEVA